LQRTRKSTRRRRMSPQIGAYSVAKTHLLLRWRIYPQGDNAFPPPNFAYTLAMTQILLPTRIYPNDDANTCHKHFYSRKPHCPQLDENTHFIRLRQKLP